ncbi:MAG: GAF domain-containing protein [Deltaproteobacteria bacterium]|nr:GAF domain-containing protein [Deltaproteobacteria bacterium]
MIDDDITRMLKSRLLSLEQSYEQKIEELSLIKEMGDALKASSISRWDELFYRQLDIIKQHTGLYSVSIMLLDDTTQQLHVVGASSMPGSSGVSPVSLKKGEGVAGKVLETGKTLYLPDVTRDENFKDKGTKQVGSLACVPIISEGSCIGVMNFRDNIPRSFGPNELRFFELISDQISITASLVKTYQELIDLEKKRINLGRYFSRGLAEHLLADERMTTLGGERRMVTVLFTDIVGFTALVESHSVEDVVAVLNAFFESIVPIIFKHSGMLDKFLGDGVMAIFGIPDANDDDPINAIRCAIDIHNKVDELKEELLSRGLFSVDVNTGISTGVVFAGNIGTEEQMNYTVIGEPVNLAQRLESIASPGEIIISPSTADLVEGLDKTGLQLKEVGPVKVKGISRDLRPMKVLLKG